MLNFSFEDNVSELKSIMKRSVGHFPSELYSDRPFPGFGCSSGLTLENSHTKD